MKAQLMRILRTLHPMNWLFERMSPVGIGMPIIGYKGRVYVPSGHQPGGPGGPDGPDRPGPEEPLPAGPTGGVTDDTLRELVESQRVPA